MASYVDSTPSFKPYVQQLPVEAMVSVGMEKQRRYDEGYQRIQSQIDKVAGLSVMRDVDKEYLQSKMNQLGNNLRMVSMGDLSNYQLVNSVGGMVNQVGKDENIQNAVISTARVREEREKMEAAQKAGKSSVNREYDFNKSLTDYLNDPKVGSRFSGQYKEHIDVNKKVLDVIGKLHPNVKIQDIVYGYNPDGSINTKSVLDAMHRQGITGVDENQIRTAINSVLDENDYDELASAGRYHYRGYQSQDLGNLITQNYQITKQQYQKKLDEVQKDLLSATDPTQVIELNNALKYYQNLLGDDKNKGKLDENYMSMLQSVSNNPDAVRADLYTRNWLDQISNGFSYREVKDEVLTSPLREDFWKKQNYNLSLIKEQNEQAQRAINNKFRERELDQELLIAGMKSGKKNPNSSNVGEGDWLRVGDPVTSNVESLNNFKEDQYTKINESKLLLTEIASKYRNDKVKLNDNGALILIEKYKNGKYTPENPSIRNAFDRYIKLTTAITNNQEFYRARENAVSKQLLGGQTLTDRLNKDLSQIGDLTVNIPGEGVTTFSSREVYEYLTKEKMYQAPRAGALPELVISLEDLSPREKKLYTVLKKRYESEHYNDMGKTKDPYIDDYTRKVSITLSDTKNTYNKVQELLAKDLADVTGVFGVQAKAIEFEKPTDKEMLADQVSVVINKDALSSSYNYDPDKAMSLLKDNAKNTSFAIISKGDSYAIRVISQSNDKDYVDIPVTSSFISENPYLGNSYIHENVDMAKQLLLGSGSTNPFGVAADYSHAHYSTGDFGKRDGKGQKTVTLPVVADLQGGIGDNTFYPIIKLKTKDGNILPLFGQQPQNIKQFEEYLKQLTDTDVITMFKVKYPNIEQLID